MNQSDWEVEEPSAVGRTRTSDFKIFSLALSQLSYHGSQAGMGS